MIPGQSGAALALTALAIFAFRASGLLLAGRLGPRSPVLAWANAVSYAMLAVYVVQTLIAPGSSLQATPTAARIAAAALAVAGFTALGRGLFQWLVVGTAAFSLGLGPVREQHREAIITREPSRLFVGSFGGLSEPPPMFLALHSAPNGPLWASIANPGQPHLCGTGTQPASGSSAPSCMVMWSAIPWPKPADLCWPQACGPRDRKPQLARSVIDESVSRAGRDERRRAATPEKPRAPRRQKAD